MERIRPRIFTTKRLRELGVSALVGLTAGAAVTPFGSSDDAFTDGPAMSTPMNQETEQQIQQTLHKAFDQITDLLQ